MARFRIELSYEGTVYDGWQSQPSGNTIQDKLEAAVKKITGETLRFIGAGRTDSGVHALAQVAHFDSDSSIPPQDLLGALNSVLPRDIVIRELEAVAGDFHALKLSKEKHYDYFIYNSGIHSPFWSRFSWHKRSPLNIGAMREACEMFVGEHDFSSFCATGSSVANKVRIIKNASVFEKNENLKCITITGTGFLRHMVRIIAGTLVNVGQGKISPREISDIIAARDRTKAGPTAPAKGLFLVRICY
jgi:tRNA pseudouridine38-40 synthase